VDYLPRLHRRLRYGWITNGTAQVSETIRVSR